MFFASTSNSATRAHEYSDRGWAHPMAENAPPKPKALALGELTTDAAKSGTPRKAGAAGKKTAEPQL